MIKKLPKIYRPTIRPEITVEIVNICNSQGVIPSEFVNKAILDAVKGLPAQTMSEREIAEFRHFRAVIARQMVAVDLYIKYFYRVIEESTDHENLSDSYSSGRILEELRLCRKTLMDIQTTIIAMKPSNEKTNPKLKNKK